MSNDLKLRWSYTLRSWRLIYAAAPGWTLAWGALLALQGLLPVAQVYLTRWLVDSLVRVVDSQGDLDAIKIALIPAVLLFLTLLVTEFLNGLSDWVRTAQSELVADHISSLVHAQAIRVDLAFYESPDYYDHFYRATTDAAGRPLALLENAGSLFQNSLTLLGMAAVLFQFGAWIPVALLISTLPALYVVVRYTLAEHNWWRDTTPERRRAQYYDTMLTSSDIAPEMRLFTLGGSFSEAYQSIREVLREAHLGLLRRQSLARLGAALIGLAVTAAAMLWLLRSAMQGLASLGDMAMFYQAFTTGQTLMRSLLGSAGQIYANSLYVGSLFEFLDLQPQIVDPQTDNQAAPTLVKELRLDGVSFTYPGSQRAALHDFNLVVPAGQVTAIVGENGSGKSTLVKLLCRFYDPQAGQITIDGIDLRQLPLDALRRTVAVLFQAPVSYHASAAENIAVGAAAGPQAGRADDEPERAEIEAAARLAGAHNIISRLPQGYDTQLGKWFADGEELSAGEWQRVALARAYLRDAPLLILDEPTSHMDSWSEADWFERLRALAAGRTTIVITHRFSIAQRADLIHVMQAGKIVESGTHAELMARGGKYASVSH